MQKKAFIPLVTGGYPGTSALLIYDVANKYPKARRDYSTLCMYAGYTDAIEQRHNLLRHSIKIAYKNNKMYISMPKSGPA